MSLANAEPNPITIKQLPSKVFVEGEEVSLSTYNNNKLSSSRDTILKYGDDYYVIDTRMLRGKENMLYECVKNDEGKMERNLNLGALVSLMKLINREGFIKKDDILKSKYNMFEVDFDKKIEVELISNPVTNRCNRGIVPWEVYELTPIIVQEDDAVVGGRRKQKTRKNRAKKVKKSKSLRKKKSKSLRKKK